MTVPPVTDTGVERLKVLTSGLLDLSVQVETPDAFVLEHDPYAFVLPVLVAVKVGVTPLIAVFE